MDTLLHFGQANFDMFSNTPTTLSPTFTMMKLFRPAAASRYCTSDRCSLLMLGWVSTSRKSRLPQSTSLNRCFIKLFFFGPIHINAVSSVGRRKPADMRLKLSRLETFQIGWHSLPDIPRWLTDSGHRDQCPGPRPFVVYCDQTSGQVISRCTLTNTT